MAPAAHECGEEIEVNAPVLWALSKEPNRRVIRYFEETDRDQITVSELAEYLVHSPTKRFRKDPKGAEIHLHHATLPELDELGVIDYEAEANVVRKSAEFVLPGDFIQDLLALDTID